MFETRCYSLVRRESDGEVYAIRLEPTWRWGAAGDRMTTPIVSGVVGPLEADVIDAFRDDDGSFLGVCPALKDLEYDLDIRGRSAVEDAVQAELEAGRVTTLGPTYRD